MTEISPAFADINAALLARGLGRMVANKDRIVALLDLLGNPQRSYPAIHITGTNGKTSTSRMIDALLRAHNLRVGRYTSPHLDNITERIAIDGEPISAEQFVAVYREVEPLVRLLDERAAAEASETVTYFEMTTAMAFAAFADAPIDIGVIEVGMGGQWDATNVLQAPVAVITPIGLDHTAILGESIAQIATEKAGIVHDNSTLITAVQPPEAVEPILQRAIAVNATVAREGMEFGVASRELAIGGQILTLQGLGARYDEIFLPLLGPHQAQNASLALAAVEAFFGAGLHGGSPQALDLEIVRAGFAGATSPGRLERVRTSPTIVVDAAHNPAGLQVTLDGLSEAFSFSRLVAVLAVLDDKDARGMLEAMEPVIDELVVTENSSARRLPVDQLAAIAVEVFGADRVEVSRRLDDAIDAAVRLAEEATANGPLGGAGVLITGSVVTVANARRLLS